MKTILNFIVGFFLAAMALGFWTCLWTAIYELALTK